MTAEQRHRVRELFEAAVDGDPVDLMAWIQREAADDQAVRAEVLSLLEHHSRAGSFLAHPVAERVPELLTDDADEAVVFAPGTVVGSYTIIREIGRGGMGRVYLASDGKLGRTVALKALPPRLTRDPSHRERLRREARAAAGLTHPGICTVYALEEIGGDLFIATEFVDGHTLRDEIAQDRRWSTDTIVATARELAAALAAAHAKGITHRDLKPENIMRTGDGRLKVLDFGLARVEPTVSSPAGPSSARALATMPGVLMGTPAYMAPEQINGQAADARSDVFAFGVVMYEFACGAHPFEATTELARLARVLDSDARPLDDRCPHLPPAIADIIERCLRKPPAERFASAAEVVSAIGRYSERPLRRRHLTWWRTHQVAVMALYVVAAAIAWGIKETYGGRLALWLFVLLGITGAIAGIVRGHLLFTERFNQLHLGSERRRTARAVRAADLVIAAGLLADGLEVAPIRPLWGVLTMAVAVGVALAAVLMEPATTDAAFGDQRT